MVHVVLPPLYVICDADVCRAAGWTLVDCARACLDGGATWLQVRAKRLGGSAFFDAVGAIVEASRPAGAVIIVNDRVDVALATGAGGIHVGQDDLAVPAVRRLVGHGVVVGLSTHSDEQVQLACNASIDYAAIGPVFGTATKATGYEARGLESVRLAAARTRAHGLPLVAIGGITLERAPTVIAAGAQSVAVISDLLSTGRPDDRVRAYLEALG